MPRRLFVIALLCCCAALAETIAVQVLNQAGGKIVRGLTAADFQIEQGGKTIQALEAELVRKPLDLILIVEERRMDPPDLQLFGALTSFAARLEPSDRVGLLVVDRHVETAIPSGSTPARLAEELTRPRATAHYRFPANAYDRSPAYYDAVVEAAGSVGPSRSYRQAAIVVALDGDESSSTRLKDAAQVAVDARLIVSVYELPTAPLVSRFNRSKTHSVPLAARAPPRPGQFEEPAGRPVPKRDIRSLQTIIDNTGGELIEYWAGVKGLTALADRLRERYELVVDSPPAASGRLKVRLTRAAAKRVGRVRVYVSQPSS